MKNNKNRIFIIIGSVIILAAALFLLYFNPDLITTNFRLDSAVDQV